MEAICVLNKKKVFEDKSFSRVSSSWRECVCMCVMCMHVLTTLPSQKDGPLYSMCMDPVTTTIYITQKLRALAYTSYKETR